MKLNSTAFENGDSIPKKYTCDGANISPPISWAEQPENTHSLALIFEDPDAPSKTWIHWVLYNIPPVKQELQEKLATSRNLDEGIMQGTNDFGKSGYGGPCPPGGTHRYFLKLYALDIKIDDSRNITADLLRQKMEGHILAQAELMGRYRRS